MLDIKTPLVSPHIHHHETINHREAAFASEPVTHEAWEEIPNPHVAVVSFWQSAAG